jgi:hypothetical protein
MEPGDGGVRVIQDQGTRRHMRCSAPIETENIAYFGKLLKTEVHPDKRRILIQLLAEEKAKHAARIAAASKT